MNKLVKVTKTKVWSEWCKNILGKYCIFKTADRKYVCGFVEEYTMDYLLRHLTMMTEMLAVAVLAVKDILMRTQPLNK